MGYTRSYSNISVDVDIGGTTPTLTIGDGGEEDAALLFDGAAEDFHVGLDDSADDLLIGVGTTLGTTPAIGVDGDSLTTIYADMAIKGATPTVTIVYGEEEDAKIIFDGHQKDFHIGLDDSGDNLEIGLGSTLGTNSAISITGDGTELVTLAGPLTVSGATNLKGGVVVNEDGADKDFRIESSGNANMFVLDGGTNNLALGAGVLGNIQYYVAGSFTGSSDTRGFFIGPSLTVNANETCEGCSISPTVITNASGTHSNLFGLKIAGLNITDTGATITNATSCYIDGAPTEATNNYALWVNDGAVRFDSATFAIREVTYTWPPDNGDSGEQLQTNGSGALTWEAAGSLREFKDLDGYLNSEDALSTILDTPIHKFNYKEDARTSTGDYSTDYFGVMADEAPWAMHHNGRIFNPINTFGYTVGAIQELSKRLDAAGI